MLNVSMWQANILVDVESTMMYIWMVWFFAVLCGARDGIESCVGVVVIPGQLVVMMMM